ncbi:cytochrome P450 [Xylariaceae sp. FL0594]|nr:cytochrome P450 [Xylariaceae sp. FL0594]
MSSSSLPLPLLLGTIVAGTYIFLFALLHLTQDAKEPPAIATSIPFVTPAIGMLVEGMQDFAVRMRDKHPNHPIHTLRLPFHRIYMVNSLALISLLQRQPKKISFAPIEAQAEETVMGVGRDGNIVIGGSRLHHMLDDDSYLSTFVLSIYPGLAPGPGLDGLNEVAVGYFARRLDELCESGSASGSVVLDLWEWIRDLLCMATTEAMYGEKNPFRDPAVRDTWHTFEPSIVIHMLKAWPSVLARKSLHTREHVLIPAFEKYFSAEIGQLVASLTNSMAAAFWMVWHVFSDRDVVLRECGAEVEEQLVVQQNGSAIVDLAKVKSSCPVLLSTWQETLRHEHIGVSARVVMEDDVVLANRYLLKKGATVMTVTPVQHTDESLWGGTAREYDHRRFIVPGNKTNDNNRKLNGAAFRAFGGGAVLCPGRHFVSSEVMALTALLLLRFHIEPVAPAPAGKWVDPGKNLPMTTSMPTPKEKVLVRVTPREEGRKWKVEYSASTKGVDMVVEDEAGH